MRDEGINDRRAKMSSQAVGRTLLRVPHLRHAANRDPEKYSTCIVHALHMGKAPRVHLYSSAEHTRCNLTSVLAPCILTLPGSATQVLPT